MYCKKIRDEREAWQALEEYVAHRSETQFSHGVCPGCWDSVVKPLISDLRSRTPAHLCRDPFSPDGPAAPPKA